MTLRKRLAGFTLGLGLWTGMPQLLAADPCLHSLTLQNPKSWTLGDTFYLPRSTGEADCPRQVVWTLVSAPDGSLNQIYPVGAAHPRFTPDLPGTYRFALGSARGHESSAPSIELKVVRRTSAERFRNHYLTPLYGAARVGQDIWVANGASYTVSRVEAQADGTWKKRAEIPTGSWPAAVAGHERLPYVLVAQRGADTIGFVDRQRQVLEDALWVGDEPSGLALSPDATTLYVSLATERAIAVVDLPSRTVKGRIAVGFDPRALALTSDGKTLFAASYRSANREYGPNGSRPEEADQDVFVIDTQSMRMVRQIASVAADLRALALSPDDQFLYVAATDGQTLPSQNDPSALPFTHMVASVALATLGQGKIQLEQVDLTRQAGSSGPFVNPSGILVQGDHLWVSSESSDQVVILDRQTRTEQRRIKVGAGPRQLVLLEDGVAVHCFQSFELFILNFDGQVRQVVRLTDDPRSLAIATGEKVFTRPGNAYAANHSCSSCHIETQNDGMIWRFGPQVWHNVRPLQLLAATTPLGWSSYVSNGESFGFMGPTSIVNRPPTNEEAEGLAAFLNSLLGAPRATDRTQLDGSYSALALKGRELFEGPARCASCHAGPLYTNRRLIPKGKSGEAADVPSLLGAYRHGVYFVNGQSRTLDDAVDVATKYVGFTPSGEERQALIAFLKELTPKGAHPLGMYPDLDSNDMIATSVRPSVAFAEVIDDGDPEFSQLEKAKPFLGLYDDAGQKVAARLEIDGGRLTLIPEQPLQAGTRYTFRVLKGLAFRDGGILEGERSSSFTVAQPAVASLPRDLLLTIKVPVPGPVQPPPLRSVLLPLTIVGRDENSLLAQLDLGGGRVQKLRVYQDGEAIRIQSFALPMMGGPGGNMTLADASQVRGQLVRNQDVPSVFFQAQGTLAIGAPGIKVPKIAWTLEPYISSRGTQRTRR